MIFHNINMCFSNLNMDKERIMRFHKNKNFIVEISKWGVCKNYFQVLGPTIKDKWLGLLNQQSALWMATQLSHNSTYNYLKAKNIPKEWTFE